MECPPFISIEKIQSQRKKASSRVSFFHYSYYFPWKKKRISYVESTGNDIKKLISNTAPESTKVLKSVILSFSFLFSTIHDFIFGLQQF